VPIGYGRLRIGSAVISNDIGISSADGTIYSYVGGSLGIARN
jgi:hypothetical protein